MYQKILIPIDGSPCSELAINQGLGLAQKLAAEVTFLYVLEDPVKTLYAPEVASYQPELYESMKTAGKDILAKAKAQAQANALGIRASSRLREYKHPVQAIHEAEQDVDLVVMGTHGRRGFNRWIFGSVAEGALRKSTKPYLMLRNERERIQDT